MADGGLDAHSVPRPPGLRPNQKTGNPCDNLREQGHCHWGDRCYYAHSQEETELFREWVRAVKKQQAREGAGPPPERTFRTQICRLWREGRCANGAACTFAHGEEHLRVPRQPGPAGEKGEEGVAETPVPQPTALPAVPRRPRPQGLCWWWHERGHCTKGDACAFLHGETPADYVGSQQVVQAPPGLAAPPAGPRRERQQEQQQGAPAGFGENGIPYDQPPACHPSLFKTVLCSYFMEKGRCRFGDGCTFAHSTQELRPFRREDDYGRERGPASQSWQPLGPSFDQPPPPGRASPPGPTPAQPAAAPGVQVRAYLPPGLREMYAASLQLPTSAVRSQADRVDLASEADFPPLAGSGPSGSSAAQAARRPASAPSPRKSAFAGGGGSMHSSGGPSTPTQAGKVADGPSSPCLGSDSEGSLGHAASSNASMEAEAEAPAAAAAAAGAEAAPAVEAASPPGAPLAAPTSCTEAISWADASEEAEREEREREEAERRGLPAGVAVPLVLPPAAPSAPSTGSSAGAEPCEGLQLQPQEVAAEAEPALLAPRVSLAEQNVAGGLAVVGCDPAWTPAADEEPEAPPAHGQAPACPIPEAPASPAAEFSLAPTGSPAASPAPMPGSTVVQPHLPQPQTSPVILPPEVAYVAPPPALAPAVYPAPAVPGGAGEQRAPPGWKAGGAPPAAPPGQPAAVAFGIHCLATFRCPLTKLVFRDPVSAQDGYTYERAAIEDWISKYGWVSPMTGRPLRELPVHSTTVRQMLDEVAEVLHCFAATGAPPPPPPAAAGGAGTPAPPPLRPPPGFPAVALQHPPPLAPYGAPPAPPASGGAMIPPPLPPHMWR